jgi:predicted peptidase
MYEYLTFLPENYEKTARDFPLIFYLHDTEQAGTDFNLITSSGLPKLLNNKELEINFIVVSPQLDVGETWKVSKIFQTLQVLLMQYRINKNQIYFVGSGIGGYGALKFATIHKDIPAAIISVAGGGNENMAFYLQNIPIWFFHGKNDEKIPFYKTEKLVDALKSKNQHINFTVFENSGHEIIDNIFKDKNIYDWLIKHNSPATS